MRVVCRPSSCPPGYAGFEIVERLETIAPHPLATLRFTDCRIPKSALLGKPGTGFQDCDVSAGRVSFHRRRRGAWALPAGLWTSHWNVWRRARYKVRHYSTCRWCRVISPIWRWMWMPQRCWSTAPPGPRTRRAAYHPRGSNGETVLDRSGAGGHRPRGAVAWRRRVRMARKLKSFTAISARCASTRAPRMCNAW